VNDLVEKITSHLSDCDGKKLRRISKILGIEIPLFVGPRRGRGRPRGSFKEIGERESNMKVLFDEGKTFQDIATIYGVSRERIRRIFERYFNLTAKENTVRYNNSIMKIYSKMKERKRNSKLKEDERYSNLFKCSKEAYIVAIGKPFFADKKQTSRGWRYLQQKAYSEDRNIPWDITFPEWWRIWKESGKYHLRGRGHGYCMSRHGDSGPYRVDNVKICLATDNIKEYYDITPKEEVSRKIREGLKRRKIKLQASP
jgi:hypothetical protein